MRELPQKVSNVINFSQGETMMSKRKGICIGITAVMIVFLLPIFVAAQSKVTLRVLDFWGEVRFPTWQASVAEFNKAHPNIKVELEQAAGKGSVERMRSEFLSGDPPNIMLFWKTYFNEYVHEGQLIELTDFIKKEGWLKGHLYDPALDWVSPDLDGRYYGLPDIPTVSVFFYNTKMFKKWGLSEPRTFDELIAVGKKIKERGVTVMLGDWSERTNIMDPLAKIQVQTAGIQPVLDAVAGEGSLTDPPLMKAAQLMHKLVQEGLIGPEAIAFDASGATRMFVTGNLGILSDKSATISLIEAAKPEDFEYDVFSEIPFVEDPVCPFSCTWGAIQAMPIQHKDQAKEAWEFMRYVWSVDWQKKHIIGNNQTSNVIKASEHITHPVTKKIFDIVPRLTRDSFYLIDIVPSRVLRETGGKLQEMVLGQATPEEVMQKAQQALEEVLKGR